MLTKISQLGLIALVCANLASSMAIADDSCRAELTPNDELIFAVKGIKNAVALLTGVMNPIIGLMVAAYNPDEGRSDLREIDKALAKGAYINYQEESSGYTALIYAAYKGYPGIAEHLISKGANVQIREKKGYNAYTMAQYYINSYRNSLSRNEQEPYTDKFGPQDKARMREHYQGYINLYQEIVNMLEQLTVDKNMPSSSWF